MPSKLKGLAYSKLFNPKRSARIFLGEDPQAWNRCGAESQRGYSDLLLLPAGSDPLTFEWPVRGLDVVIFNTRNSVEIDRLKRTILACLYSGAKLVVSLLADDVIVVQK